MPRLSALHDYLKPFRKLSGIVRNQSPPSSPSSSSPLSPSWGLWLVSALQGHAIISDERRKLVNDIERMTFDEQELFIEFLKTGVAPSTLENNACKQFVCNTSELCCILDSKDPQNLVVMWEQLYQHTLPVLQSILYPLQRTRRDFNIRRIIITIFRDKVLSRVLRDVQHRIPILEPMLFTVLLETDGTTQQAKDFAVLASLVMGTNEKRPAESDSARIRSRTLPCKPVKKVTWGDTRKSATFSI
ncbi:unnamed protein product [Angiostrongylus costaricensis]|uniref:HEAT repeat-containing protein 1 n=1 Tax=Angiostrongylus costaricensis TaxID=334426 RepID=A0A0R3PH29_ANGCS|nr:unnamed protein product [Angiostrongylus costaricensis]